MEKILSKAKQEKLNEAKKLTQEYKGLRDAGTKSWAAVDYLAEKHGVTVATVYRRLKSLNAFVRDTGLAIALGTIALFAFTYIVTYMS